MGVHKIEGKGRINLKKIIDRTFEKDDELILMRVVDHFSIFTKDNFEKQIKNVAEETKLPQRDVALYFSESARDVSLDEQGRLQFSKQEREVGLNKEKEIYIIPLSLDGVKSLEIYPKSTYERIMKSVEKTISGE